MAAITLNINDAFVPRVVAAFRAQFPGITTGLADGAAAKAVIIQLVKEVVTNYEAVQATNKLNTQIQVLNGNQPMIIR